MNLNEDKVRVSSSMVQLFEHTRRSLEDYLERSWHPLASPEMLPTLWRSTSGRLTRVCGMSITEVVPTESTETASLATRCKYRYARRVGLLSDGPHVV